MKTTNNIPTITNNLQFWQRLLSHSLDRLAFSDKLSLDVLGCGTGIFGRRFSKCRFRLCPRCTEEKISLIESSVFPVLDELNSLNCYRFMQLDLSSSGCSASELSSAIDDIVSAFNKLMKRKKVNPIVVGYLRFLHVSFNKRMRFFVPHLHVILLVPKYFTYGYKRYISNSEWKALWLSCLGHSGALINEARYIKLSDRSSYFTFTELLKHTMNYKDYLFPEDTALTDLCVSSLLESLRGRRLITVSGPFCKCGPLAPTSHSLARSGDTLGCSLGGADNGAENSQGNKKKVHTRERSERVCKFFRLDDFHGNTLAPDREG